MTREQHDTFEAILDKHNKVNYKEKVARYLYLGGIRGSLYSTALSRFFESNAKNRLGGLGLAIDEGCVSMKTVCYIFEKLCPASDQSPLSGSESDSPPSTSKKRKWSSLQEYTVVPELHLDSDAEEYKVVLSKEQKNTMNGLKRLSNAYMKGIVPRGSYGRILRLNWAGWHFYLRMRGVVIRDDEERTERLFFMVLCGSDYNIVPMELGIRRLMTGAVTNHRSFAKWCQELKHLLWGTAEYSPQDRDYHNMGKRLAGFTKVPPKMQSTYWMEVNCGLMVRTMKYVCELWNMKRTRPGPVYGLSVRDSVVCFDCKGPKIVNTWNDEQCWMGPWFFFVTYHCIQAWWTIMFKRKENQPLLFCTTFELWHEAGLSTLEIFWKRHLDGLKNKERKQCGLTKETTVENLGNGWANGHNIVMFCSMKSIPCGNDMFCIICVLTNKEACISPFHVSVFSYRICALWRNKGIRFMTSTLAEGTKIT